ncbi:MAG: hypothetical protein LBB98_09910 [Treponema sp.]|nr:hypothetical protein [Treponema sp.]
MRGLKRQLAWKHPGRQDPNGNCQTNQVHVPGSLGETRPLADGFFEAKIRYGPGFRQYFVNKGVKIIVLLCDGDKSTQRRDIAKAREMAKRYTCLKQRNRCFPNHAVSVSF